MKKLWMVVGFCLSLAVFSNAQGIEAGDNMFSMFAGVGGGLQDSGLKWQGETVDWGAAGATIGLSYMVFPSEYFGVGLEINDGIFGDEEHDVRTGGNHYEMENAMNVFNAMASFRFNFNPQSRVRFYIPFGGGLSSSTGVIKQTINGWEKTDRANYNSLGWFAGAGLEVAIGSEGRWALGAEGRYNAFQYDTDKLMQKVGTTGVGKKDYSYVSVAFKASYRF